VFRVTSLSRFRCYRQRSFYKVDFNRLQKSFLSQRGLVRFDVIGNDPVLERERCAVRIIGPGDYSAT